MKTTVGLTQRIHKAAEIGKAASLAVCGCIPYSVVDATTDPSRKVDAVCNGVTLAEILGI